MGLNNDTQYPGRTTPASAAYPQGSSKNETAPGANDGMPYELARANDLFGLIQGLLFQTGIVASGAADTAILSQYLGGIMELASKGRYFVDSGIADAYVLSAPTNVQAATKYFDGMESYFLPLFSNTGAATADTAGLGPKVIVRADGTALQPGDLIGGSFATLRFDLANNRHQLVAFSFASAAEMLAAVSNSVAVTPGRQDVHPAHPKCKVVFDGTGAVGPQTILGTPYNVTSVVKNSTGVYTVTMANALPDGNYAVLNDTIQGKSTIGGAPSTTTFVIDVVTLGGTTPLDSSRVSAICV